MSALCLTLAEGSLSTLNEKIRHYAGRPAFIETRLDYLSDPEQLPDLPATSTRFIATCRPVDEGGRFAGPEAERLQILERAADVGFAWVDLERTAVSDLPSRTHISVVRSHHDFSGCPEDLSGLFAAMRRLPGRAVKIAVTPADSDDSARLLRWMETLPKDVPRVILGMGREGQPTRVLAPLLGSLWTYVVEDVRRTVAPGQFTLGQAVEVLRFEVWQKQGRWPAWYGVLTQTDLCFALCAVLNRLFDDHGLEAAGLPLAVGEATTWLDYLCDSPLRFHGLAVSNTPAHARVAGGSSPGRGADLLRRDNGLWQDRDMAVGPELPERIDGSTSGDWARWLAAAFEFWTGLRADEGLLRARLEESNEEGNGLGS